MAQMTFQSTTRALKASQSTGANQKKIAYQTYPVKHILTQTEHCILH